MKTPRTLALITVVFPVLALAACGSEQQGTGVASLAGTGVAASASPSPTTSSDPLKFARCMRENGIDMPDPDGRPKVNFGGAEVNKEAFAKAQKECGKYMAGGMGADRSDPKVRDRMLKFAQCMRENGVNMPDPSEEGGMMRRGDVNPESETFKKAMEACRQQASPRGKDENPAPGS
ncbi:hypothetical protein [Sinosporangium siamense]|uniref:Uncharacterized protein n=1 Tax=Sinosporangium siamense TaxID=1367973 RepID=A0A919V778_9ACTN|nr:hypothetical protein [Sinosporangium siamense]GII91802.1 hypothetical protein Ssi02_20330 [Sinosporangium siamense]